MSSSASSRAAAYAARSVDPESRARLVDALVRLGDLRGRRVLDVGCGPGEIAALLAERHACTVWGVDTSEAMLALARARVPPAVGLREGRAERLPFRDAWFERVLLAFVVHLVDRPRSLAEAARVLRPGGRIVLVQADPEGQERHELVPYFPGLAGCFPTEAALRADLAAAGFAEVAVERLVDRRTVERGAVLERLRAGGLHTLDLLDPAVVAEGRARVEAAFPERVEAESVLLLVAAERR